MKKLCYTHSESRGGAFGAFEAPVEPDGPVSLSWRFNTFGPPRITVRRPLGPPNSNRTLLLVVVVVVVGLPLLLSGGL